MAVVQLNSCFLRPFNFHCPLRSTISSSKIIPMNFHQNLISCSNETISRRSANWKPSSWSYDFVESLTSEYLEQPYITQLNELKSEVKITLEKETNPLNQLEMIDVLQRLGVAYHFEDDIENLLNIIKNMQIVKQDLYVTALVIRLLRQEGYNVPQEVFDSFRDEQGKLKAWICDDIKANLYLYEASYLSIEGENILDELREFTLKNLKACLEKENDEYLSTIVKHALEFPFHWRMQRAEARWFINVYENCPNMKPVFLQLSQLDFNVVQATHKQDLKHSTSWWKGTGLGENLNFVRARPMEVFLWTVGGVFEPQFAYERRILARMGALVTVIDDIYDVYASLDEIQLFTDAVERWDINATDQLPHYMKICYFALYNTVNETTFDILKDKGLHVIPYLKKAWADLCKCYLLEAKWYHSGYTPTLEEYMETAWISISAPLLLVSAYFLAKNQITNEATESIKEYPDIVRWSSMIIRLADDLGTSLHEIERGDNPKSVQCYMHETGVSEEKAREHICGLIDEAWKKLNETQMENKVFPRTLVRMAMNLARMAQFIYQSGDGFGALNLEIKSQVMSLLVQPFPLSL